MSFSSQLKQELAALSLGKPCCMLSELSALSSCCASIALLGRGRVQLRFQSYSISAIKRSFRLLSQRFGLKALPRFSLRPQFGGRKQYQLLLDAEDTRALLRGLNPKAGGEVSGLRAIPRRAERRICCRRAYIRGVFLGCGLVQDIRKGYRAEFLPPDSARAEDLIRLLRQEGIEAKRAVRRGRTLVYLRDGDSLATLLGLMGTSRALLSLESLRAENSIREGVNRATNCDEANTMKQLAAAQRQVEKIVSISLNRGLSALPKDLEQLARLRLSNPDAGLKELAALSRPPVSKSGLQYRMRRIMDFDETGTDA